MLTHEVAMKNIRSFRKMSGSMPVRGFWPKRRRLPGGAIN
jgi:hypothetical protein